ncbi:hypothetical protein ACIRLA_08075 [Streptomyces sp. NPDC102364]|uniref:hypothetical protein n=1 Tax=Streptomyces sp. NPDC102364 TaxID=3366161 RepID=UPI00382850B5
MSIIGVLGAFVLAFASWRESLNSSARTNAARQRVLDAEEGLQDVLRGVTGERSVVIDGLTVTVEDGRLPETSGEEDDGANDAEPADSDSPRSSARTPSARNLGLPELWTVTHRRLDLYHEIATGQASRSFRNAQAAMILGFALLAAFVVVALNASTTTGAVVAGGLGAVAAALSGFVSRTFVRSQETAASHLRSYFDQPLEFSRYLAAERLVVDSKLTDEQHAEVVTELAKAMIAGPVAPNVDSVNGSNSDAGSSRP